MYSNEYKYMMGIQMYTLIEMKGYVKDTNGKYKLTEKQEPIVMVNQQLIGPLTLEELDARLKRVEGLVIGAQK